MKGAFVGTNPLNDDMLSCILFRDSKRGYNFLASIYLWEDGNISGKFDFNFAGSELATNFGLSVIFKNKNIVFEMIDKMFLLGCSCIQIAAHEEKKEKRLLLYEYVLRGKYIICDKTADSFFIERVDC